MSLVRQFEQLWNSAADPPDVFSFLNRQDNAHSDQWLQVLLTDQKRRWATDSPLKVEDYLAGLPHLPGNVYWKLQLAIGEFEARRDTRRPLSSKEISSRFPDLSDTLQDRLKALTPVVPGQAAIDDEPGDPSETQMQIVPGETSTATCLSPALSSANELPHISGKDAPGPSAVTYISSNAIGVQQKGRYRLDRVLGEGGFGRVYLGFDEELQRQVSIKVPTKARFQKPEDAEAYLAEARTVASLDHPNIVSVYDVGRTEDGSIYVVSRFVDGATLDDRIKAAQPAERESARLLATVALALQYAHQKRLIHRDIKPANILIEDSSNTPFVADFGLAIREEDYLKQSVIAGTPAYMSPEQARGEGHRLDGRSDIFSLGVILYQLLTAKNPFRGGTVRETLRQVISVEPKPPRELLYSVPAELERICLKALSKRASDRYATAAEFADDLEEWLKPAAAVALTKSAVQVVPKGLRSFDASDAGFFLELLPGQRNRDGLPESIAFWKQRIEQTDPEHTFSVGLIYGPSGCGKSSLVKAGLLPHLSDSVIPVYVEATLDETATRILRGLRKRLPELSEDLSLADTLAALRRGRGQKVVIIIDQFEQWLHAHRAEQDAELVRALRQCDGARLQVIVMVRDDFSVAAARLMRVLDIPIVEGHNFALVDLFDVGHAAKVLTRFGQAFGKLPANSGNLSPDEQRFVSEVAGGLAQEGKVVSVRLSLFAEMVKGKPWTTTTLQQVGGTEGIGVNFLEETFSSPHANPRHRLHSAAARGILKALLPGLDTDIKGGMRPQHELQEASGYGDRPSDFADVLRILDGELRLITPTDPEGHESQSKSDLQSQYYQLTHDYLVPSLREWLTRKQRETRKGRAELKLAERSSMWNAKPEKRYLPSLNEWLGIRTLTESRHWTVPQRVMMKRAGGFHLFRLTTVAVVAALITTGGLWTWNRVEQNKRELLAQKATEQEATRIEGLVGRLSSAEPAQVPAIAEQLAVNPDVANTFLLPLVSADAGTLDEKRARLHARLARVSQDKSQVEPLLEELFTNKVAYIGPIRQQLRPYAPELKEKLWAILRDGKAETDRRFRAGVALADYVPEAESASWIEQDLQFVAEQLVSINADFQPLLRENLQPISGRLLADLEKIFGNSDGKTTDAQRLSAANALADYFAGDIPKLSQLLTVATPEQYGVLYPIVASNPAPSTVEDLGKIAATLPAAELGSVERVPFGQRRANAAVTLLRLGEREQVLPVFEMTDDPEALTQFIFRCRDRGVRVEELLELLRLLTSYQPQGASPRVSASDASARTAIQPGASAPRLVHAKYALLLALGEYTLDEIPDSQREALLKQLSDWYRNDPSSGVHGAVGWLLRHWGQNEVVQQVDQTAVPYAADREWFTLAITVTPTSPPKPKEESAEENAAADPGAKTDPPSETSESKKEATDKQDKSDGPESPQEETKPEPTPEALPPKTFYYTFIVFPAGDSRIGSSDDEPDREKDEVRHDVTLTRPFALLDREMTWEELIAFKPMYAGYMQQSDSQPEAAGASDDWYHAVGFCRWLGQQYGLSESDQSYADPELLDKEGYPREPNPEANWATRNWPLELDRRGFRLPTESEWEVASRAGARTTYGYGSDATLLDRFGWFQENSGKQVHPPRELRPSRRGVFDLHGNLFEWTHDWFGEFGSEAVADPLGPQEGSSRVVRGGCWSVDAADCRTAMRFMNDPTRRSSYGGFRLALSPSSQSADPGKGAEPSGAGTEGASAEQRPELP